MYLVIATGWKYDCTADAARAIAATLGIIAFEAQQKIARGGPVVLATYAEQGQAEETAQKLLACHITTFILDTVTVREEQCIFQVSQFRFDPRQLQVTTAAGRHLVIDFSAIELILSATCSDGQLDTIKTTTRRKFSMGKTLLAGGIPMTKKVKTADITRHADREKTLWLFSQRSEIAIFNCNQLDYSGLGEARGLTRDLNFAQLQNRLQQCAPHAVYDKRLLKRADQINLLGPSLDPDSHLDLAFEILARSLKMEEQH